MPIYNQLSSTALATASTLVQRDSDGNTIANNFNSSSLSITPTGGTTILTAASPRNILVAAGSVQNIQLPNVTTLYNGFQFFINNSSDVTVKTSNGTTLAIQSGSNNFGIYTVIDTTAGGGVASWKSTYSTYTNTPSSVMSRNSSGNTSILKLTSNSVNQAVTTYSPGGTTTTNLTSSSSPHHELLTAQTNTFVLPNATTLVVGDEYEFTAVAGTITLQDNSTAAIAGSTITAGQTIQIRLRTNSTAAGIWDIIYIANKTSILTNVVTFLSSGTYTPSTGIKCAEVVLYGGGGGGGGGCRHLAATSSSGGGGGGGGAFTFGRFTPAALGASVSVTVGTGGTGGTAAAADSTAGGVGGNGSASLFGTLLAAGRGGGGGGGQIAAVSAGGGGGSSTLITGSYDGGAASGSTGGFGGNFGANGSAGGSGTIASQWNGMGGSGCGATGVIPGQSLGYRNIASGGAGAGLIISAVAGQAGQIGGGNQFQTPGTAGAAGAAGGAATNSTTTNRALDSMWGVGGGGGGSGLTVGGAGGAGGTYGGGGGGGGSCQNGGTAGAGGAGGAGIVIIVEFF